MADAAGPPRRNRVVLHTSQSKNIFQRRAQYNARREAAIVDTPAEALFDAIRRSAPAAVPLLLKAPASEWEVVFLLGQLSANGGFRLVRGTGGFPDCTLRLESESVTSDLKVEVEVDSSQYIRHKHPLDGCDAVVCWSETTKLPIPTMVLSSLFGGVAAPALAKIRYSDKQEGLVAVLLC